VERDKPAVFPRPDILTIRTTDSRACILAASPAWRRGVACNLIPGDLQVSRRLGILNSKYRPYAD
jgi:hypothetical protein